MSESITVTDEEWESYKKQFNKIYEEEEDKLRRSIYIDSKNKITEHNKKFDAGEVTWSMGINQFADKKKEETCGCMGSRKPPRKENSSK